MLTLHAFLVPPSLGDMTCAYNFLSVTGTDLRSMLPKSVNTFIVSNILNVFVACNFEFYLPVLYIYCGYRDIKVGTCITFSTYLICV